MNRAGTPGARSSHLRQLLLALAGAVCLLFLPGANNHLTGQAKIIDGDTLRIGEGKVRLHGIDAPEIKQQCRTPEGHSWQCGLKASATLAAIIGQNEVICTKETIDRYGRFIGTCYQNGKNLNAMMVSLGWALAYRRYSTDYTGQETAASSSRSGIWSGDFVAPWLWRRGNRLPVESENEDSLISTANPE